MLVVLGTRGAPSPFTPVASTSERIFCSMRSRIAAICARSPRSKGSLAYVERANALWRVQLVSGDRKQIACDTLYIDRHLPCRLYGVSVKIDIGFGCDFAKHLDRLQHAGLVVRHHDRDELCVRTQSAANVVGINQPAAIDGNVSEFASHRFQMLARVQDGMMFNG